LKVCVNADHLEHTPLGRMEWIKFFAAFFSKSEEADSIFTEAKNEYHRLKALVKTTQNRPEVFVNIRYGDVWFMPGGRSYMSSLLQDAGGKYMWAGDNSTGSMQIDFETVYQKAGAAEYWLNTGSWSSIAEVLRNDQRYGAFKAVKTGNVFNNNKRVNKYGGNDYWESGFLKPQVVLADLISIFHPGLLPDHELFYYQKLKKQ
jgi:iron complex transport system substrate-binding protein